MSETAEASQAGEVEIKDGEIPFSIEDLEPEIDRPFTDQARAHRLRASAAVLMENCNLVNPACDYACGKHRPV